MVVPAPGPFGWVELGEKGMVGGITPVDTMPIWVNGGNFVLRQEGFEHIPENGDLVADGCAELAKRGLLLAYPYRGYWRPTHTLQERGGAGAAHSPRAKPRGPW